MHNPMSRNVILFGCTVLLMFAGCSRSTNSLNGETPSQPAQETASKRIASTDVVKLLVDPVEIKSGESAEVSLRLTIQNGYHVNANPPTFPYLIPTELAIVPTAGVSASTVSYPAPINAKFAFSEKPLAVYEGNIEIKAILKAEKSAQAGQHSVAATLRVQACDDQVCYPPGTRKLEIPVTIK